MEKRKRRTKAEMEEWRASQNAPEASKFALQDVQIKNEGDSDHLVITGYINICRSPKSQYAAEWYYTGSDIHDTKEKAQKIASHTTIGQVFIEFVVKDRKAGCYDKKN